MHFFCKILKNGTIVDWLHTRVELRFFLDLHPQFSWFLFCREKKKPSFWWGAPGPPGFSIGATMETCLTVNFQHKIDSLSIKH